MKRSRAILTLAGVAATVAAPARAQTNDKLSVGFPILDPTSEVLYAHDLGFFERAGLDVELTPLTNGAAIAAAVASGTLDIGLGNALTIISAYSKGIPLTVIAPAAANVDAAPSNLLLVAKNSPLRTAADLNGKIVGVSPLRGIGEIATSAWMDKNGGDSATVHYIEVPFPQAAAMLAQARADADTCSEPFITQAASTTRVFANPFAVLGEGSLVTAFFAMKPWALAHADLVARFDSVIRDTAKWANAHPDASAAILATYSKMDVAVVKETVRSRFATVLTAAQFQPTIDAAARYKLLDRPFAGEQLIFQGK